MRRHSISFALITAGTIIAIGASQHLAIERRGDGSQDPSISITSPTRSVGSLIINAVATIPAQPIDLILTWHVTIRTGDLDTIAENEYPTKFHVKEGHTEKLKFHESLLIDPGQYDVLVELLDQRPTINSDGSITAHSPVCGASKTFTVR